MVDDTAFTALFYGHRRFFDDRARNHAQQVTRYRRPKQRLPATTVRWVHPYRCHVGFENRDRDAVAHIPPTPTPHRAERLLASRSLAALASASASRRRGAEVGALFFAARVRSSSTNKEGHPSPIRALGGLVHPEIRPSV